MVDPPTDATDRETTSSSGRRRRWPWVALGTVIVVGLAVGGVVISQRRPSTRNRPGVSPSSPPRPAFAFGEATVKAVSLRVARNRTAAVEVAGSVRATLSGFYQAAFVDPRAWTGNIAPQAWTAFAPATRRQAQSDAGSLTLGKVDGAITDLLVSASSLKVTVLFDGHGRPQATFADVRFVASAKLQGGETLRVTNNVHFYLQPISGSWLITGYPGARTILTAPAPQPSGSPGPSPSGPSGPTPTGS
jgi:hypothetical protein